MEIWETNPKLNHHMPDYLCSGSGLMDYSHKRVTLIVRARFKLVATVGVEPTKPAF